MTTDVNGAIRSPIKPIFFGGFHYRRCCSWLQQTTRWTCWKNFKRSCTFVRWNDQLLGHGCSHIQTSRIRALHTISHLHAISDKLKPKSCKKLFTMESRYVPWVMFTVRIRFDTPPVTGPLWFRTNTNTISVVKVISCNVKRYCAVINASIPVVMKYLFPNFDSQTV